MNVSEQKVRHEAATIGARLNAELTIIQSVLFNGKPIEREDLLAARAASQRVGWAASRLVNIGAESSVDCLGRPELHLTAGTRRSGEEKPECEEIRCSDGEMVVVETPTGTVTFDQAAIGRLLRDLSICRS